GPAGRAEQRTDLVAVGLDIGGITPVDHGEQVVAPAFTTWTAIAVTDEGLGADQCAEAFDLGVVDVPHGHAVVPITQTIVVGYRGTAPNRAVSLQALQQRQGLIHLKTQ